MARYGLRRRQHSANSVPGGCCSADVGPYGLGWLRRLRRINPPGNPISNARRHAATASRLFSKEVRQSTLHRAVQWNPWAERISAHTVLGGPGPLVGRSPKKPDKYRPIRRPERVPVGPTVTAARCAKASLALRAAGFSGRWLGGGSGRGRPDGGGWAIRGSALTRYDGVPPDQ
jgi:hypothetical protein